MSEAEAGSVTFAGAPRSYPPGPTSYKQQTKVRQSHLLDRGELRNRIIEAGGEAGTFTITLEECKRLGLL